jgi:hypothetical protein
MYCHERGPVWDAFRTFQFLAPHLFLPSASLRLRRRSSNTRICESQRPTSSRCSPFPRLTQSKRRIACRYDTAWEPKNMVRRIQRTNHGLGKPLARNACWDRIATHLCFWFVYKISVSDLQCTNRIFVHRLLAKVVAKRQCCAKYDSFCKSCVHATRALCASVSHRIVFVTSYQAHGRAKVEN